MIRVLVAATDEEDLAALYTSAELFVFPSLAEGFGLPPLEAMACGTPVLVARTTAVPEVCGDAAEYYAPPEDPDALADAIVALARDPERRARLKALGRNRAQQFEGPAGIGKAAHALLQLGEDRRPLRIAEV